MKTFAAFAVLGLALAGCSGGGPGGSADTDGDGEVSMAEAQSAAEESGMKPEPGLYKVSMEFVKAEGMPPEVQAMMGSGMSNTTEFCMTPEMAEDGFGKNASQDNDDCTIGKYDISGDQMDMEMTCLADGETEMTMSMTGTVSPTGSELTMISEGMIGEMGEGKVEMKMTQERIGDCEA